MRKKKLMKIQKEGIRERRGYEKITLQIYCDCQNIISGSQGMAASKPRFGRTRFGSIFWLCIWLGEPLFGYLILKRYFSAIVKIFYVVLLDTALTPGPPGNRFIPKVSGKF